MADSKFRFFHHAPIHWFRPSRNQAQPANDPASCPLSMLQGHLDASTILQMVGDFRTRQICSCCNHSPNDLVPVTMAVRKKMISAEMGIIHPNSKIVVPCCPLGETYHGLACYGTFTCSSGAYWTLTDFGQRLLDAAGSVVTNYGQGRVFVCGYSYFACTEEGFRFADNRVLSWPDIVRHYNVSWKKPCLVLERWESPAIYVGYCRVYWIFHEGKWDRDVSFPCNEIRQERISITAPLGKVFYDIICQKKLDLAIQQTFLQGPPRPKQCQQNNELLQELIQKDDTFKYRWLLAARTKDEQPAIAQNKEYLAYLARQADTIQWIRVRPSRSSK